MFVVEEFMLLANRLVGEKLLATCAPLALLRKHTPPQEKKQQYFTNLLSKFN
jgi:exoribonuclease R